MHICNDRILFRFCISVGDDITLQIKWEQKEHKRNIKGDLDMFYKEFFTYETSIEINRDMPRTVKVKVYSNIDDSRVIVRLNERLGYRMPKGIYAIYDMKNHDISCFRKSLKDCINILRGERY